MFDPIFTADTITFTSVVLCTAVSLGLGLLIAAVSMIRSSGSRSSALTLAVLPTLVQVVIMLVNGNLGAGVAVMGAFSLVRFRTAPGSARDIVFVFFAMSVGLATGMGYLAFAAVMTGILAVVMVVLTLTGFGKGGSSEKELRVTIPENLDYTTVFDDLLAQYTASASLEQVKTVSLGSMYELRYKIRLKDAKKEKEFLDAIRCRNGNLTIVCGRVPTIREEY